MIIDKIRKDIFEIREKKMERVKLFQQYLERGVGEKSLTYDQWLNLYLLREEQEKTRVWKNEQMKEETKRKKEKELNIGDRVTFYITINGKNGNNSKKEIGGVLRAINKDDTYDISTGFKFFKNVPMPVWKRKLRNFPIDSADKENVIIPDEYKKMSTERLLNLYRSIRFSYYYDVYDNDNDTIKNNHQKAIILKAELNLRGHILGKDETRVLRKELADKNKSFKRNKNK